jgi:hypothetical protein
MTYHGVVHSVLFHALHFILARVGMQYGPVTFTARLQDGKCRKHLAVCLQIQIFQEYQTWIDLLFDLFQKYDEQQTPKTSVELFVEGS